MERRLPVPGGLYHPGLRVPGADTQLLVDVNMLPFIALENIDFLRDGAAASYGSDAIAGVTNFRTRSDFTGIELSANHKVIEDSGGDTEFGFIGGMDLARGRGHITTSASGVRRSELELYQRDWAIRPYAENPKGGWSSTGRPATFVPGNTTDVNTHGIIHCRKGERECKYWLDIEGFDIIET